MFHEAFEKAPVVIAYTLAASGGGLIQVRQKPADADSFMAGLEHELMAEDAWELIGWLAIEEGSGYLGAHRYAAIIQDVDAEETTIEFPKDFFWSPPKVLGSPGSTHGVEEVSMQAEEVEADSMKLHLESKSGEGSPPMSEKVSIFAFESGARDATAYKATPIAQGQVMQEDPDLEAEFQVVDGMITAPGPENDLEGPYQDESLCLRRCMREVSCCGVVTVPSGNLVALPASCALPRRRPPRQQQRPQPPRPAQQPQPQQQRQQQRQPPLLRLQRRPVPRQLPRQLPRQPRQQPQRLLPQPPRLRPLQQPQPQRQKQPHLPPPRQQQPRPQQPQQQPLQPHRHPPRLRPLQQP